MTTHYELKGGMNSLFQGKYRADGPSQHALDFSLHLVLPLPSRFPPFLPRPLEVGPYSSRLPLNIGIWTAFSAHHERTTWTEKIN